MKAFGKIACGVRHVLNRFRFAKGDHYDPGAFWESRHAKYQSDFRAVADSVDDAHDRYPKQKQQFLGFLDATGIKVKDTAQCIEFGCGNGFWAQVLLEAGAPAYTGLDISTTAVRNCRKNVPCGIFEQVDLGEGSYAPPRPGDLVLSIDVTQHIVEEVKLGTFLRNMEVASKPGGHLVLTSYSGFGDGYADTDKVELIGKWFGVRKLRWVYAWDVSTLKKHLSGCELVASSAFWDKTIFAFVRRVDSQQTTAASGGV